MGFSERNTTQCQQCNGTLFLAALNYLKTRYDIKHIRVSGYNSQSHGAIEVAHRPVREALIKTGNGDIRGWHNRVPYVFWAERIIIKKATGLSPFYMAHGIEPLLLFDITMATYLLQKSTPDYPMENSWACVHASWNKEMKTWP